MTILPLLSVLLVVGAAGRGLSQLPGVPAPSWAQLRVDCDATGPFPYFVSLRNDFGAHYCGGVLVSESAVLTAASCVDPAAMTSAVESPSLYIGGFDIFNPIEIKHTTKTIVHPSWTGNAKDGNDIAILKMNSPTCVKFIPGIGSYSLPGATHLFMGLGRSGTFEPFSNELLVGDYTVATLYTCRENNALPYGKLTGENICTKSSKQTGGICEGDEGGPLIERPSLVEFQDNIMGIASYVSGSGQCSDNTTFGVFTSISPFATWIASQLV